MNIWHLTEKMVNHLEPSIPAHLVAGSHEITTSGRSYLRSILRGSAPGPGSAIPWHGAEVVSPRVRLPSLPDDNQPPPDSQDAERDVPDERPHRFKVRQQGDEKGSRDDKVDVPELAEAVRDVGAGGIEGLFAARCSKLARTPIRADKSTAYAADARFASARSTCGALSEPKTWLKRYGSMATRNNIRMFRRKTP